ncbi:MAG TPA: hypothetical protein VGN81_10855 [Pseudonocardiaceae bacterium]
MGTLGIPELENESGVAMGIGMLLLLTVLIVAAILVARQFSRT